MSITSLSPSRAQDFMQCPQLFKYRAIDRLPEPPSAAALKGTLVHGVLELMFDLPAVDRTLDNVIELVEEAWDALLADDPSLLDVAVPGGNSSPDDVLAWLNEARPLIHAYFRLEDPRRLEPEGREVEVRTEIPSGLVLRGFVDRLDIAPDGAIRIVDYKTGRAPKPAYEGKALFQMRFYALVVWRIRGEIPKMLQLLYLGSGDIVRYEPTEDELLATERTIVALHETIERAIALDEWPTKTSRLCDWCAHKAICPAFS
jgi:putative RecB family exonuclease